MEFYYYFIFAAAFFTLQLLVWNLVRTLAWLSHLTPRNRKILLAAALTALNMLPAAAFLRLGISFKWIGALFAVLWLVFIVSTLTFCILKLGRNRAGLEGRLKAAYPLVLTALAAVAVYHAYTPRTVYYSVQIDKPLAEPLRIGLASDLHLGRLVGKRQIDRLAALFAAEKVDMVLLAGDIMDDSTEAYTAGNLQSALRRLKAPLGVYAALGNHDYMVEPQKVRQELEKAGLTVLEDESVSPDGRFYVVGRKDDMVKNRRQADALLAGVDTEKPVFLVEHRPTEFPKLSTLPVDLAVAGHTHKGQIAPANLIAQAVNFMNYGYRRIGSGHFIVTSGFGFWAVPFRLGSQSEIAVIDVRGTPPARAYGSQ
ncbi:metallophosphoesterase [Neisseria leonii]|uniref:Metallophosphoesterase n=1 Tax=Neisseria leonii TaxID=2995413 RepID=A0A9X4ICU9_9NEIS|nr:metallophosphoesterase [Neisseria sp. 51.81]MDD9327011.1 metallophosphoesterase [Neisseria sp. 51.81]